MHGQAAIERPFTTSNPTSNPEFRLDVGYIMLITSSVGSLFAKKADDHAESSIFELESLPHPSLPP